MKKENPGVWSRLLTKQSLLKFIESPSEAPCVLDEFLVLDSHRSFQAPGNVPINCECVGTVGLLVSALLRCWCCYSCLIILSSDGGRLSPEWKVLFKREIGWKKSMCEKTRENSYFLLCSCKVTLCNTASLIRKLMKPPLNLYITGLTAVVGTLLGFVCITLSRYPHARLCILIHVHNTNKTGTHSWKILFHSPTSGQHSTFNWNGQNIIIHMLI